MAPRVQRQRRMLPGKLVVFRREPRKKRATHANLSRTHTLAKTGNFWFCWRCRFCTAQRVKGLAGQCRGVVHSRGGVLKKLKDGRNPKDGRWLAEPTLHAVGRADVLRRTLDGTGVTWLMSWSATSLAWISLKRDTNLACHCSARTCASFVGLLVTDAVSLIRTSSQKQIHRWTCMMLSGAELGDLKDNLARSDMT